MNDHCTSCSSVVVVYRTVPTSETFEYDQYDNIWNIGTAYEISFPTSFPYNGGETSSCRIKPKQTVYAMHAKASYVCPSQISNWVE